VLRIFFSYSHVGENSVMALRMLRHCTKTRVAALRALSVRDEARSAAKLQYPDPNSLGTLKGWSRRSKVTAILVTA